MAYASLSAKAVVAACESAKAELATDPAKYRRDDNLAVITEIHAVATCAVRSAGTTPATVTLTGQEALLIVDHFPEGEEDHHDQAAEISAELGH